MCFRQELGKCAICYSVAILGGAATMDQASFGLSDSPDSAIAKSAQDGDCPADFLQVKLHSRMYIQSKRLDC